MPTPPEPDYARIAARASGVESLDAEHIWGTFRCVLEMKSVPAFDAHWAEFSVLTFPPGVE